MYKFLILRVESIVMFNRNIFMNNLIIFPPFFIMISIFMFLLFIVDNFQWHMGWMWGKKNVSWHRVVKWQLRGENGSARFVFKLQARRPPKSPVRNENNIVLMLQQIIDPIKQRMQRKLWRLFGTGPVMYKLRREIIIDYY